MRAKLSQPTAADLGLLPTPPTLSIASSSPRTRPLPRVIALEPSGTVEHQPDVFRGFASNARGTSNKSLASFSKSASFSRVQICK